MSGFNPDSIIEFFVKVGENYCNCFIFREHQRYSFIKGCDGMEMIITMSNGWTIKTNDLWYEKTYKNIQIDSLIGTVSLNTDHKITNESYIY